MEKIIQKAYNGQMQMTDSALVSAQRRRRIYFTNFGDIPQPQDRGILLKDVLESGVAWQEKLYCMTSSYDGAVLWNTLERGQRSMVAVPLNTTTNGKSQTVRSSCYKDGIRNMVGNNVDKRTCVAEPITLSGEVVIDKQTIYEVKNGFISIKGKSYSIKLPDGFYIIRKLTISECRRLQTIPDWYIMPCSATQSYKQLGNGWTVEVVKHYLSYIPDILSADIDVISLYDGMSCGRIALTELGANIRSYKAYEIDKFAIQTTQANFPDTVQLGDAFAVRAANWKINT